MLNALHFALQFWAWARTQRRPLSVALIRDRWLVNRSTAYRWQAAWEAFVASQIRENDHAKH